MKHKRLISVLVVLLILAVFLLPELQKRPLFFILRPLVYMTTSVQGALTGVANAVGHIWSGYMDLGDVQQENENLKSRITRLENENSLLREDQAAFEQLESLLDFKEKASYPVIASRVIGRDPGNWYQSMLIDKGEEDGIAVDMGVIVASGVVGRVMKTTPHTSHVLLLTDHRSAIPVLIQETRDEGLVVGTEQEVARIKYLPILSEVKEGDAVLTSGLVGSFPKGLPVGRVRSVDKREMELFQEAEISPLVDFSKLENVMVIAIPRKAGGKSGPVPK